ncbi:MAG: CHAT domain-containing protein, partial [Chloroflexota bacterium]
AILILGFLDFWPSVFGQMQIEELSRQSSNNTFDDLYDEKWQLIRNYIHSIDRRERAVASQKPNDQNDFDLEQLQDLLCKRFPLGWLALDYIVSADKLLICAFNQTYQRRFVLPLPPQFARWIKESQKDSAAGDIYLRKLGNLLIPAEIQDKLHPDLTLLISPHSEPLHNLPWPAIKVKKDYLIHQARPLLVPSLAIYQHLASNQQSSQTFNLFVTAVSQFTNPAERRAELPFVDQEVVNLNAAFGDRCTLLQNEEATFENLRLASDKFDQFNAWHIASHGFFNREFGDRISGFALYDQDVYTAEIGQLAPLPETIFISACSGLPLKVFAGDEISGLPATLLIHGAKTVIGCLWPVADQKALEISKAFYDRWLDLPNESHLERMTKVLREFTEQSIRVWGGYRIMGIG